MRIDLWGSLPVHGPAVIAVMVIGVAELDHRPCVIPHGTATACGEGDPMAA